MEKIRPFTAEEEEVDNKKLDQLTNRTKSRIGLESESNYETKIGLKALVDRHGSSESLFGDFTRHTSRKLSGPLSSRKLSGSESNAPSEEKEVLWQWEHRTGFRNYDAFSIERIEKAYQNGVTHVRLKSGKRGSTPMEVFLIDMVQLDPVTGNHRSIRRIGPDPWWQKISRFINGYLKAWETGKPRRVRFSEFSKQSKKAIVWEGGKPQRATSKQLLRTRTAANIVNSNWFFGLTMWAVVANTVYIGIEADRNSSDTVTFSQFSWFLLFDNLFCTFFTVELMVRFGGFQNKWNSFQDRWFVFDSALVLLMIGETWLMPFVLVTTTNSADGAGGPNMREYSVLRIARLLRLSRLGRIVRLLRIFPEIMTLLKGIAYAMRSVFFTLLLLLILLFLFGIVFKTQAKETGLEETFTSVSRSMWVLLIRGTFLDSPSNILEDMLDTSPALAAVFLLFIFMSSFTVMNMLIGILVDVVHQVSQQEKEQASITFLKNSLFELLECFDKDDDRRIHQDEFELLMRNPELNLILKNFGVNCLDLMLLKDILFEEKEVIELCSPRTPTSEDGTKSIATSATNDNRRKLTFDEFVEVVVRLRGGNSATVLDVVELRELICLRFERLEKLSQSESSLRRSISSSSAVSTQDHTNIKQETWQTQMQHDDLPEKICFLQKTQQELLEKMCSVEKAQQKQEMRHADMLERICEMQRGQQQQQAQQAEILHAILAFQHGAE